MNRLLAGAGLLLLALLVAVLAPVGARGHIGGEAFIQVPLDHVMPGQTFPVIAADVGAGATVSVRIVQGEREAQLGSVTADPDGHFQTSFQLPADFPHGYAQLIATADDGSEVSTYVLVGPREQVTGEAPRSAAASEWWLDPSVLILAGMVGVAGLALFAVTIRSARRERAAATAPARRRVARKGGSNRRRR
ncbi:MAG: hypothetical protein M3N29_01520 [Chloroflexota bacterium]|nr:hypothetical protein [Chloroflexota bacterium]